MHSLDLLDEVKSTLSRMRGSVPEIDRCLSELEALGSIVLFGGAVRDLLRKTTPRDYDFVIDTDAESLHKVMRSIDDTKRNRFGGYRACLAGTRFDFWTLRSTWAFSEGLIPCSIRNLTKSVFLNIDAVVADLTHNVLYGEIFKIAMLTSQLDIVLEENPFPALCVLRTLVIRRKGNFTLSPRLRAYVLDWARRAQDPLSELMSVQQRHYGMNIFDEATAKSLLNEFLCQDPPPQPAISVAAGVSFLHPETDFSDTLSLIPSLFPAG